MQKETKQIIKQLLAMITVLAFYTVGIWHVAILTKDSAQAADLEVLTVDYENCQWDLLKRNAEIGKLNRQIDSLRNDELERYKYIESQRL